MIEDILKLVYCRMHPILFDFGPIQVYSYGFCIMLGALLAYFYALKQSATVGLTKDHVSEMTLLIILSAYVGGKVFLWFSDWDYYMQHPKKMIELNGSGFVFYGSFIFCITSLFAFFRFRKVKPAPAFDVLAVCTAIVHAFGKIGCLMAGCCHGKVCSAAIGIVYHNPLSQAHPLDTPLYPVPLVDATIILGAAFFLMWYGKRKKFAGELMLWYIFIYATARFFTEFLRGDDDRGFIGPLSQSQWVSIGLLIAAGLMYVGLKKRSAAPTRRK
jgi:phosphatidylglycerol---prolipoprotein diacylglyceryl transferase